MSLCIKLRTCLITFILLINSILFFAVTPNTVLAQPNGDEFDLILDLIRALGIDFDDILNPHPYRLVGTYYTNEKLNITGDVNFNLYFSSTFLTQFGQRYKDKINVSLHYYNILNDSAEQINNANKTITLEPELFGEYVQEVNVEFKDINHVLNEGEYLLISVELIQSEKPISKLIGQRFENKIKGRLGKIADFLNKSQDPQVSELGDILKGILTILEEVGIGAEEITDLANSFRSSSFYYGSDLYKSSTMIPILNSVDNKTLYFHNQPDLTFDRFGLELVNTKIVNETEPSSDIDNTWPPSIINLEQSDGLEYMTWFFIWLLFAIGEAPEIEDEEILTYYLNDAMELVPSKPDGDVARVKIKGPVKWEGISLERNKIIKNASAELYIHYPRFLTFLRRPTIKVELFDETENKSIDTSELKLDRTTLLELIARGPDSPTIFVFSGVEGTEIWHDNIFSLRISVTKTGRIIDLRPVKLLCNSNDYPSSVTLKLKETENIKLGDVADKKIIPGGTAELILDIESEYNDTVEIDISINKTKYPDHWSFEYPESVDIDEGDNSVSVFVRSTENTFEVYGESINLIFNVTGKTGFDSTDSTVLVSIDAVDIDFEVIEPKGREIKHGEKGTYKIIIKNMNNGFLTDSYSVNATSEHGWEVSYPEIIYNLEPYVLNEKVYVLNVTLSVPQDTEISSDILEIIISSEEARIKDAPEIKIIEVKTLIIGPNILESFYNLFESLAERLGLDNVLGDFAAGFLLFIFVFLILIILIIIVFLIKRKFVEIVCLDRIKEISPDEEATYNITIQNPYKKTLTYEIHAQMNSEGFEVSLDNENIEVEPKQSSVVLLTVKPNDYIKVDDWLEVKVVVKVVEKSKTKDISTVTTIKDGDPKVKITGVIHWPRVFKKGDRVDTSFRLRNVGNVSATNINVILNVNGKEKNKVEDITIPRGGYAEIEIPWIAEKGKNKVNIVVK